MPAHRPPKNTHRSQRKSISLQTEHPLLRRRHLHRGSASAAVCRRGCVPSSAPEINTQTWATAAFIIAARFIFWLSHLWTPRQSILLSARRRAKGGCFCVCFTGAIEFAAGAVRINSQLEGRNWNSSVLCYVCNAEETWGDIPDSRLTKRRSLAVFCF